MNNSKKNKLTHSFSSENNQSRINFFSLGGQDERGKNCYVLEIDNNIFIFNAGSLVPTTSLLGVKQLIPDFDWLVRNKNRIKGLFVGYPTQENLGSLENLLKDLGPIPIYTSLIGKAMIETLAEKKVQIIPSKLMKIIPVENMKPIMVGNQKIIPFKVCNSMPWSLGFAFDTKQGYILYIDDFILYSDNNVAFESHLNDIALMVHNKVFLLIVGVGYIGKNSGYTSPQHKSKPILEQIINETQGRVFVACYDSNAYTLLTVAQLARQKSRPLIIYSHTFINIFSTIIRNKIFNNRNLLTMPISAIDKTDNAIVCVTSNPHRLYARLSKIANGEDDKIHFQSTDSFVLVTPRVAGYEGVEAKILDDIARNDVDYYRLTNDVLPMQASDEDHKYLLNLLKPKYVIPTSGLYNDFIKYANVAKYTNISLDQIRILYNGEIASFKDGVVQKHVKEIKLDAKYIDSSGVQDVGDSLLFEREQMAENGVVIIVLFYNRKSREFLKDIKYEFYGITDEEEKMSTLYQKVDEQVRTLFKDLLSMKTKQNEKNIAVSEVKEFKQSIKKTVAKIFEKNIDKKPIVLPTIVDL